MDLYIPRDYKVEKVKEFARAFADRVNSAVGFRRLIPHEYGEVEDGRVMIAFLDEDRPDMVAYVLWHVTDTMLDQEVHKFLAGAPDVTEQIMNIKDNED